MNKKAEKEKTEEPKSYKTYDRWEKFMQHKLISAVGKAKLQGGSQT